MPNEKGNYIDRTVCDLQGMKSFIKVKYTNFGKLQLSGVNHSGKDNGAKQLASIDAYMDYYGRNGALFLAEMVTSGVAKKLATRSKEAAAKAGSKYPQPIFKSQGGTSAEKSKDNKPKYREILLAPGSSQDYVLTLTECDAQVTKTGGYRPAADAKKTTINVGISSRDLVSLAKVIEAEYSAYRVMSVMKSEEAYAALRKGQNNTEPASPAPAPAPAPAPQNTAVTTPAVEDISTVVTVYDDCGALNGRPYTSTLKRGWSVVERAVQRVQRLKDYDGCSGTVSVKTAIENGTIGNYIIDVFNNEDPSVSSKVIVIIDKLIK